MAKRTAGTELNHDNWDQDEDQEQAGIFKKVRIIYLPIYLM